MNGRNDVKIARGARLKAEADFATWLMMAKLGSFADLPKKAQSFLEHYRDRLQRSGEKQAASQTITEIAEVYYGEMGGSGALPEIAASPAPPSAGPNVIPFNRPAEKRTARSPTAPTRSGPPSQGRMPVLLIFAALVAMVVAAKYLMGAFGE